MAEPLKREQILDTAEEVLRRFGLEKTSVVDVARALGVSHGTLYRHFPSKAVLKEAVAKRWLDQVSSKLSLIVQQQMAPVHKLQNWIDTLIHIKQSKAAEDPELFAMYNALAEESVEGIQDHIEELIKQLTEIIREGITSGEFVNKDAKETAAGVFYATARFHHPSLANEWLSPSINKEFEFVWSIISQGFIIRQ